MPPVVSANCSEVKKSEVVLWQCLTCLRIFFESDEDNLEKHLMIHPVQFYPKQDNSSNNKNNNKSSLDYDIEFSDLLDFDQEILQQPPDSLWSSLINNYNGDLGDSIDVAETVKCQHVHDNSEKSPDKMSEDSSSSSIQHYESSTADSGYDETRPTSRHDDSMDVDLPVFHTDTTKIHDRRDKNDMKEALKSGKRFKNLGSENPIKRQKTCEVKSLEPPKPKFVGYGGHSNDFGQKSGSKNQNKILAVGKSSTPLRHHDKKKNSKLGQTSTNKKTSSMTNPYESKEVLQEIANMQILVNVNQANMQNSKQMIEESLEITYKYRFHDVFARDIPICTVMSKYPGLQFPEMLAQEFERTTNRDWSVLEKRIIELVLPFEQQKFLQNLPEFNCFAKILQTVQAQFPEDSLKLLDFQMACMLYNHSKNVPEGKFFLLRKKPDDPRLYIATPNIDIVGELGKSAVFTVYCEMTKVSQVYSFYHAIMIVYYLYWIFHLEYQSCVAPFFEVFDNILK